MAKHGSIESRTDAVKKVFTDLGYGITSHKLDIDKIGSIEMPELQLNLDRKLKGDVDRRISRKIRQALDLDSSPRVLTYPDDATGKNIVVVDLFAKGGKVGTYPLDSAKMYIDKSSLMLYPAKNGKPDLSKGVSIDDMEDGWFEKLSDYDLGTVNNLLNASNRGTSSFEKGAKIQEKARPVSEVKDVFGNWAPKQLSNISRIVKKLGLKDFYDYSSGGGVQHIIFFMPDKSIIQFNNEDTISISKKKYKNYGEAYWDDEYAHMGWYPDVSIEENFSNVSDIARAVTSKDLLYAYDEQGYGKAKGGEVGKLNHSTANQAYSSLIKVVDMYDGYASEHGVEKDNRYWGDMEELNKEIDATIGSEGATKIKTSSDVMKHWNALTSIAKKVVDGADGYLAERGNDNRYLTNAPSKIRTVKKMFGIENMSSGGSMATGGGAGQDEIYYGVVDANNKLVFESADERTAKQVSWNYEGSIVKKYKGSSMETGGGVEEGDRVIITTKKLGKQFDGMMGEITSRKLLNDNYSIKLENGMTMAFEKGEFRHNSINPKYGNGGSMESGGDVKKTFVITFQDAFSGATEVKEAPMTASQYQKALEQKANKDIVAKKFQNNINWEWMIKDIREKEGSMAAGGLITHSRAREIANNWHGGQHSALYQFASSGEYMPENHLKYLREVQSDMEPEYHLHPGILSKKNERELNSLKRYFEFKGQENGIKTEWAKHELYGYMIPYVSESTPEEVSTKVKPLHLPMAGGGDISDPHIGHKDFYIDKETFEVVKREGQIAYRAKSIEDAKRWIEEQYPPLMAAGGEVMAYRPPTIEQIQARKEKEQDLARKVGASEEEIKKIGELREQAEHLKAWANLGEDGKPRHNKTVYASGPSSPHVYKNAAKSYEIRNPDIGREWSLYSSALGYEKELNGILNKYGVKMESGGKIKLADNEADAYQQGWDEHYTNAYGNVNPYPNGKLADAWEQGRLDAIEDERRSDEGQEPMASGGKVQQHLDSLYEKSGSIDAAMREYAGELGIFDLYYGHKVDPSKKAKWNRGYDYLNKAHSRSKGGKVGKNKTGVKEVDDRIRQLDENNMEYSFVEESDRFLLRVKDIYNASDLFSIMKDGRFRWQSGGWNHGDVDKQEVLKMLDWSINNKKEGKYEGKMAGGGKARNSDPSMNITDAPVSSVKVGDLRLEGINTMRQLYDYGVKNDLYPIITKGFDHVYSEAVSWEDFFKYYAKNAHHVFLTKDRKYYSSQGHSSSARGGRMETGGMIRKVKVKIPEKPYFVYATVERELPQTIITNKGIFPKDDIIKEFMLDSRIIKKDGGEISKDELSGMDSFILKNGETLFIWEQPFDDMGGETNYFWRFTTDGKTFPTFKEVKDLMKDEDRIEMERLIVETSDSNQSNSRSSVE